LYKNYFLSHAAVLSRGQATSEDLACSRIGAHVRLTSVIHLSYKLTRLIYSFSCDADPNALAEYVAALLERDAPESQLRIDLSAELDEFLEKGWHCLDIESHKFQLMSGADGPNFINGLFNALRTQSYLPYSAASPSAGASADPGTDNATTSPSSSSNPASSPNGNRKRSLEDEGEHPPAKGPRLGNNADGRRPPMGSAATMDPGHVNPHRQPGGPKVFIPPEQVHGVCRDYHGEFALRR
jgi:RNA-binding protein 26